MWRIALVWLALVACGSRDHDREPAPGDLLVLGWWQMPDGPEAEDLRGAAVHLTPTEMIFVLPDHRVIVRTCKTIGSARVAQVTGCGPLIDLAVDDAGRIHFPLFVADRITGPRTAELDAVVAKRRPPPGTCERAHACYRLAMAALGEPADEAAEFRILRGPTDCEFTIRDLASRLERRHVAVPAQCR